MKTSKIIKAMVLTLSLMLMMTGCMNVAAVRCRVVSLINRDSYTTEDSFNDDSYVWDVINKSVSQYQNQDHTPSEEKVVHRMLWLGYTKVSYENLDLRMNDEGRQLLENVAYNFEHVVEKLAENNVDIQIDLFFVDEERALTCLESDDDSAMYLDHDTIAQDIQSYNPDYSYDSVMTAVQSGGDENLSRNCCEEIYFEIPVFLGLNTHGICETSYGYSTFDLGDPCGQELSEDPTIPSMDSTAVAVHEWMHQFEGIGNVLGVEFPITHSYMGGEEFEGYQTYEFSPEGNFDYFEFYAQVLNGTVPYTDENGDVHYVGMYPEMWKLTTIEFWEDYAQTVYDM